MRLVTPINIEYKDNKAFFAFDGNLNIKRVVISSETDFSENISVCYAQNQVTSDLINFSYSPQKTGAKRLTYEVNTFACASHIVVSSDDIDVNVLDVTIFEEEELNASENYPNSIDKELSENYYIDSISIETENACRCQYSVYTSMDGQNYDFIGTKPFNELTTKYSFCTNGKEARFIRVYVEYVALGDEFTIRNVSYDAKPSATAIVIAKDIDVCTFDESQYNIDVTSDDTYDEVYGIISRTVGDTYKNWFILELADNPKKNSYDYFELSDYNGKIRIRGNNGVSLATGLNHYYKYFCNVNIAQVGSQTKMPDNIVPINGVIHKETKAKLRYAYNYCTLSYTMAFWGEKEWRKELDWLALNGVNLVLDLTAQEEVWRRFLKELGYSHEAIKEYIAGPAYYAWAYMANLFKNGGPLHDNWFGDRTELARKNHLSMRKLGMYPILQGYSGMVPVDIKQYDADADVIEQGMWCVTTRPSMLRTTSPCYKEYAKRFYRCQREVYGGYSSYYATDPFHEGGKTEDMQPKEISELILRSMIDESENAVWVIQSWQGNPSSELLVGLDAVPNGKEHALILDLYAEKTPHYTEGKEGNPNHGYSPEFDGTPWIFCMLNNFGGRLGLHGHLDNLVKNVPVAFNTTNKNYGIGITPEASENNPVLYDFFFECIWQDDATESLSEVDIDTWLGNYALRRYGKVSASANASWQILKNTVYKADLNMIAQGAPECVLNARPALDISSASAWGNAQVGYDSVELKKALKLLAVDYESLKDSPGYMYDLTTLALQVLSNSALEWHGKLKSAYKSKDVEAFKNISEKLLEIADTMESVTSQNEYYLLGRWVTRAEKLADGTDDFTKNLYRFNAKALVTTWGAYNQSEIGMLHDYSNKPWSGLISEFYKPRWERWLTACINELENRPFEDEIDWFEMEWQWAIDKKSYPNTPSDVSIMDILTKLCQ